MIVGLIVGVYSVVDEESMMFWNGQLNYVDWEFCVDVILMFVVIGGDVLIQCVNSGLIGWLWFEGLQLENVNQGGFWFGQDLGGNCNCCGNFRNQGFGQCNQCC